MASYSKEDRTTILNTVCERLSNGEALRTILKEKDMIDSTTFYKWIDNDAEKAKQYARACANRADYIFDQITDIADDGTNDWMEKHDSEGNCIGYVLNGEHVQRSRLRVDTRKWQLSKLNPKKYGDKIQQEMTIKDESFTPEKAKELEELMDKHKKSKK